ncbi:MAG: pyridoxal-phosphate-dependent aminotransferase family protein [Anaerolineae bacterium]
MPERDLLMIPGPVMCHPAVLRALSRPVMGHVTPEFINIFGETLERLQEVLKGEKSQAVVVAGSGTLAMDMTAASLLEPGDKVVVLNTGVFGDRFAAICERYGAEITTLQAELGDVVPSEEMEKALQQGKYKLLTVTHVDTSTGVIMDIEAVARLAAKHGVLSVVDGICAAAGAEVRFDEWGIDVYVTASQKALGVPPGLAILMVGSRALTAYEARRTPVTNYFADLGNWLPIMRAYQGRERAYFATPAVNLICALHVSLELILAEGLENCYRRHELFSQAFKAGMTALDLQLVPVNLQVAAPTLTAIYYPDGVDADLLTKIRERGVTVTGGIHPQIRDRYFRVGHMGAITANDLLATIGAIEGALHASYYEFDLGAGLAAAQERLAGA